MPRLLDTKLRAEVLYDGICDLIVRGGARAATLRAAASEVGLNTSSLRHHFGTHSRLLAHVLGRAAGSVGPQGWLPVPRDQAHARRMARYLLDGLLPLDERRFRSAVVISELQAAARFDPELGSAASAADERLVDLCRTALAWHHWCRLNEVEPVEVAHLHAVVDGLRRQLCDPHVPLDAELAGAVLHLHLEQLGPRAP
jgi:AcrR family transcriptional regulator